MRMTYGMIAMIGAALAGCSEITVGVAESPQLECPDWACDNSPEFGYGGLFEFNLRGAQDPLRHVSLATNPAAKQPRAQIYKGGIGYDLHVKEGRLLGSRAGFPLLEKDQLVGAELRLLHEGNPMYSIRIMRVRQSHYFVGPPDPLEAYVLRWFPTGSTGDDGKSWCKSPLNIDPKLADKHPDLLGLLPEESVVYEGDRIDPIRKTMSATADLDWFNIGCAGYAIAKLRMTRNTVSSPAASWAGRQATLKMFAADYCGTGRPFTVSGEPLTWKGGLVTDFAVPPRELEARWDENGAKCIWLPRLEVTPAPTVFPDVWAAIDTECPGRLAWCDDPYTYELNGALRISGGWVPNN